MFDFFRRHQRSFFLVITTVIVISFSFFGTFGALSDGSFREQIAFKAVDGTLITRHELDEMVMFIGTDAEDKRIFGGAWGPNFLNDGVIKKDFLETGLGLMLMESYPDEIALDLQARLDKEKRYSLYIHPNAPFIGVQTVWNYFAPTMGAQFNVLRTISNPVSRESLQARTSLFLMEKQLSSSLIRQMLRYQEKQYSGVKPDPNLDRIDLSLFGYHTTEDWFGSHFTRLAAEFVINAAITAEKRGYYVSKADAMSDLIRNTELSFQQNAKNPNLGVATATEYLNEQLRRLGMDRNMAVSVWRQVLLFRRLFQDLGSSVFVDSMSYAKYDAYASEAVEGDLYRLSKEFQFNNYRGLQKFETYLDAIAKRSDEEKAGLKLPEMFLSPEEIAKKTPELVQKRYLLEVAHVDKKTLEVGVSLKQSWDWEVEDAHFETLKKQFPELALKLANTREERFQILDSLDSKTRARVDAFSREAIVNENPQWIELALNHAKPVRDFVGLRENGASAAFVGLKNGQLLMQLLDTVPLKDQIDGEMTLKAEQAIAKLKSFSPDGTTYYQIVVIDRAKQPEVLTFAEADRQGVLDRELDRNLEAYYIKNREANPLEFQRADKTWKPFNDVKDAVANRYFERLLKNIQVKNNPTEISGDHAATLRLVPYMEFVKSSIEKTPSDLSKFVKEENKGVNESELLSHETNLSDQWKLEKLSYQTTRGSADLVLDKQELFSLQEGAWTKVNAPLTGNVNFFHLNKKQTLKNDELGDNTISTVRNMLSNDVQQRLMAQLLNLFKVENAISLEYLKKNIETSME